MVSHPSLGAYNLCVPVYSSKCKVGIVTWEGILALPLRIEIKRGGKTDSEEGLLKKRGRKGEREGARCTQGARSQSMAPLTPAGLWFA